MTAYHKKFMQQAINLATKNVEKSLGGPFGAVIVKDGKIVSKGSNRVTAKNDPTCHAEINAIRKACKKLKTFDLTDCVIYTSAEPCPMCISACYWARISVIFYGNSALDAANINFDDDFIYKEIAKPIQQRKIPTIQIMAKEAKTSFDIWSRSQNKIPY